MASDWKGGCLCGAIRYTLRKPLTPTRVTHCYCGQCRRAHGAAFATYGVVLRKSFALHDPRGVLRDYQSSPDVTRSFCGECGSSLFWSHSGHPASIDVAIGTFDDEAAALVGVGANIFAASRAPWVALDSRVPSFACSVGSEKLEGEAQA